eukprot:3860113-Pyramimonas_sp.AAC.1
MGEERASSEFSRHITQWVNVATPGPYCGPVSHKSPIGTLLASYGFPRPASPCVFACVPSDLH